MYVDNLLSLLLLNPEMTPEDVAQLNTSALDVVVPIAAERTGVKAAFDKLDPSLPIRERLYRAEELDHEKQARELKRAIGPAVREFDEAVRGTARFLADLNSKMITAQPILQMLQASPLLDDLASGTRLLKALGLTQFSDLQLSLSPAIRPGALERIYRASQLDNPLIHTATYRPVRPRPTEPAESAERRRAVADYDIMFKAEGALRRHISGQLEGIRGQQWWKRGVPRTVREACELRKADRESSGTSENHPIAYAWIDDYRAIVLRADNWRDCFGAVFGNRQETEACFLWIGRARIEIMHARPLGDEMRMEFIVAANRILRAIDRSA